MSIKIFIAGTDTGVGKTYVTTQLLKMLSQRGLKTVAIKPLATGGYWYKDQLYNEDGLSLLEGASIKLPYSQVNPVIFEPPVAPHIAAGQQNCSLTALGLRQSCETVLSYPADICFIEGVGGWYTPLNDQETMADFVRLCDCNVILVVGMRLGCLNHALLTQVAIQRANLCLSGWIANCIDPHMQCLHENIASLQTYLTAPFLGMIPYH